MDPANFRHALKALTPAQRDVCHSYIKCQAHRHWIELPQAYDDGGYSGGTLERPALRRLLADIEEGRVDAIVIYKIHRLTRSLLDFRPAD
jgi:DNA invertase Pin-like site-specific DNA recombinase